MPTVTDGDADFALEASADLASRPTRGHSDDHRDFILDQLRRCNHTLLQRSIDLLEEGNTPKALDLLRKIRDNFAD